MPRIFGDLLQVTAKLLQLCRILDIALEEDDGADAVVANERDDAGVGLRAVESDGK